MSPEAVIDEALKLAPRERARVVAKLIESLENTDESPSEAEYYAAWTELLDRRSTDVRESRTGLVDVATSLDRARDIAAGKR